MNGLLFTGGLLRWNTFNYWLLLVAGLRAPLLLARNDVPIRFAQAFAVVLGIGLIVSPAPVGGMQDMLGFVAVFGLFVYFLRGGRRGADWFGLALVMATMAWIVSLLYLLGGTDVPEINPNAWMFGPLTALVALCLGQPFAVTRPRGAPVIALLAAPNLVWIFLSGSRGGMLLGLACALYLVLGTPGLRRRAVFLGVTSIIGLAAVTQFTGLQAYAMERVNLLFDQRTSLADRTSKRSSLIIGGLTLFRENPLGAGTGGFTETVRAEGSRLGLPAGMRDKAAHAGWIKVLVENGVPGFLMLAGLVVSFAVMGLRRRPRAMRRLGLFASAFVAIALLTTEYQSKGIWFLVAGAAVMLSARSPLFAARRRA
jgi:hypothetical protein